MTTVCETLGVARSNIAESVKRRPSKARGRPPLADRELVDEIKTIIDDMPTYGYRRVHVATTEGIKSEDVQDLVITAVENRFGLINTLPKPIEWLTDNGSCFIAKDTR